jgi:hypothetical protein
MDHALIDRRAEARLPRDVLRMPQATLRPGCPVDVIDLSPQGLQVQSLRALRPGSRVQVRLVVGELTMTVGATVLRCAVWALDAEDGLTYRGGLRFDETRQAFWEEQARVAHLVHAPP